MLNWAVLQRIWGSKLHSPHPPSNMYRSQANDLYDWWGTLGKNVSKGRVIDFTVEYKYGQVSFLFKMLSWLWKNRIV